MILRYKKRQNKKIWKIPFLVLLVFFVFNSNAQQANGSGSLQTQSALRGNGMMFTQNKGQIVDMAQHLRPDILFKGDGGGADVYVRKTGISYVLSNMNTVMNETEKQLEELSLAGIITPGQKDEKKRELMQKAPLKIHRVDIDFADGNPGAEIITADQVEGYNNYYYGHCPQGVTHVNSFNEVTQKNIYPGIDVKYYGGKEHGLKYDIVVNPGADPSRIKLKYSGADEVIIKNEKLIIKNSINHITEYLPKVYQNINGKIVDVKMYYVLEGTTVNLKPETLPDGRPAWNSLYPLVIDPWATYYSGSTGVSYGTGLATDATGNVSFTGQTRANNFPVNAGAFQTIFGSPNSNTGDAFVVKFNSAGARIFGTYFGGNDDDYGEGVATDQNNNILVSGSSTSANFPSKSPGVGAYQAAYNVGLCCIPPKDAFIAKFTPAGLLIWSTLYGGKGEDMGRDIISDSNNNIIVVGGTRSVNFPVTALSFQSTLNGGIDAFIVKFNSMGVRQWATYYGGTNDDDAAGVASDAAGDIFFTGFTNSVNFPVGQIGANVVHQITYGGGNNDAFVVKCKSSAKVGQFIA